MPFIVRWTIGILVLIAATALACKMAGAQDAPCRDYAAVRGDLVKAGGILVATATAQGRFPIEFWASPISGEWTVISRVGPLGCRVAGGTDFEPVLADPIVPGKDS